MQKSDFKKGQDVFLLIIEGSNAFRPIQNKSIENRILRATVITVGSKYITVQLNRWEKVSFYIADDFRQAYDCCEDYKLFLTEQDLRDYEERRTLFKTLHDAFGYSRSEKYSLEQLQAIKAILENES